MTCYTKTYLLTAVLCLAASLAMTSGVRAATESGSIGVEGRISAPPPSTGASISVPRDGQVFNELPVTVAGICPDGLLVKVFKNNVFAGSSQCNKGSFSIVVDLFSGTNELVARVYDALDQAGPDSNTVRVTYNDSRPGSGSRVSLTSNFAKRGANSGQALTWPIILSGGEGPYAVSVDWGDGKPIDLSSRQFPGPFDIVHIYDNPGVYNVIVKAVDKNGGVAYLQLVGVSNGPLSQESDTPTTNEVPTKTKVLWQPVAIMLIFIPITFWLGKKYQLKSIRKRLERGERPF